MRSFALALLGAASLACTAAPSTPDATTLQVRIVLMRHGVRSPTSSPAELAVYASRPWQSWPVAPGMLTPHGAQGMQALGSRYRRLLIDQGLWSGQCATLDHVVVVADSTTRNHDSGAALARGLAAGCQPRYLALATDRNNPLFHFGAKEGKDEDAAPASPLASWPPQALDELQSLLLGCTGDDCLAQAGKDGRKLLLDPARDDETARAKALKSAGSLSENLMLEYAQGFPSSRVAWGQGDAATIGRLISLHNLQFALTKKRMPASAQAGSNLMAHILATLQQAAGKTPAVAPLATPRARTIILVGHDTNLANLAGVLDVDWHDAAQPDDYPPGGALVFDLYRVHGGAAIRVSSLMPTLDALRDADFDADDSLVRHVLTLPPCRGQDECPLATVSRWLATRMDAHRIDTDVPRMSTWPAASP